MKSPPKEFKKRILPQVCSGDIVIAVSMSEPDAGSALTDLKTTAKIEGENVLINGQKRWCSGAGHADGYLVYCLFSKDILYSSEKHSEMPDPEIACLDMFADGK